MKYSKFFACLMVLFVWVWSAGAYNVWLGTHQWDGDGAYNLDQWDRAIENIDGINYVLLDSRLDVRADTEEWRTMIAPIDQSIPGMAEIARSQYLPGKNISLASRMENEFATVEGRGQGEIDIIMLYDEASDGVTYNFTSADFQEVRDWLDGNGHDEVTLSFDVRAGGDRFMSLARDPLIDEILIEASATKWVENENGLHTALQSFWTDPRTNYKPIRFQIPRSENSAYNQYEETRRALKTIKELMGDEFMRSDRVSFIICNYSDRLDLYPETANDDTLYTNTKSGIALSLIEQRDVFEGRTGVLDEAFCLSYARTETYKTAPTYGNGGTPGSGDPWVINGAGSARIEAENFDQGAAGEVYYDTIAGNAGGVYRTDVDVDISSGDGGYVVSSGVAGEWLQYTVDVEKAGNYDLTIRYARGTAGDMTLSLWSDGSDLSGDITVPSTGSWSTYSTVTTSVALQAGVQALRLQYGSSGANINWIEFAPGVTPVVTLTTLGTPVDQATADAWSDSQVPHSGADYVIPATGNLKGEGGSSAFPGFSLTVEAGGKYQVRSLKSSSQVTTVNSLILEGGTDASYVQLAAGTGTDDTNVLDGNLANSGSSLLATYGAGNRNLDILSRISGTGTLQASGGATVTIFNTANTFAGTWEVGTGTTLQFNSGEAVGPADIEVLGGGTLTISGAWMTGGSLTVADAASTVVNFGANTWLVSSLVFGGSAVAEGSYSAAQLNALGANSVFTGSGTIFVSSAGTLSDTLYSGAADAGVKEDGSIENLTGLTSQVGTGGSSPWVDRAVVYVFQLPDLGVIDNPFLSSSFSFNVAQNDSVKNSDLYGIGKRSASTVLGSDYYGQTATADPTDATRIQSSILTDSTVTGIITAENSTLTGYLNAQYDGGNGIGQYVFLRLNSATAKTGINRAALTMSEGGVAGPPDTRPQLSYTAINYSGPIENQGPTISGIGDQTIFVDTDTGPLAFTLLDDSTPSDSIILTKESSNTGLVPTANIVFGGSGTTRTVTVTPMAGKTGSAEIFIIASDGEISTTNTFTLVVKQPPELIAGWDTWDSGSTPSASVLAAGITGSAVTISEDPIRPWHTNDGRGASNDGTWGSFAGPPTASTVAGDGITGENLELPNAVTGGSITFTVSNNGTADLELNAFHADLVAFRDKAARTYTLSVLAGGGISAGTIYTSGAQEITQLGGTWDNSAHDEVDHSLLGLADHILAAGESAQFLLTFSGGAGDESGGHDLWVDNVGISGAFLVGPEPEIPMLVYSMSDSHMVFNWTNGNFKLQTCTNLMDASWFDYEGGSTSPVSVTPTNSAAFFRLIEQ